MNYVVINCDSKFCLEYSKYIGIYFMLKLREKQCKFPTILAPTS